MHGGKREGAGRPAGSKNRSTPHQNQRITELAKLTVSCIAGIGGRSFERKTESARVSAANALLDRAFGRPSVHQHIEVANSAPQVIELIAKH